MTYKIGDLVRFAPEHTQTLDGIDPALIGMPGIVVGAPLFDEEEYLSVRWADGETIDTHTNDLEHFA